MWLLIGLCLLSPLADGGVARSQSAREYISANVKDFSISGVNATLQTVAVTEGKKEVLAITFQMKRVTKVDNTLDQPWKGILAVLVSLRTPVVQHGSDLPSNFLVPDQVTNQPNKRISLAPGQTIQVTIKIMADKVICNQCDDSQRSFPPFIVFASLYFFRTARGYVPHFSQTPDEKYISINMNVKGVNDLRKKASWVQSLPIPSLELQMRSPAFEQKCQIYAELYEPISVQPMWPI